jgi:hypothetical protein
MRHYLGLSGEVHCLTLRKKLPELIGREVGLIPVSVGMLRRREKCIASSRDGTSIPTELSRIRVKD